MNFKLPKMDKKSLIGIIGIIVLILVIIFIMINNNTIEGVENNDMIKKNIIDSIGLIKDKDIQKLIDNETDPNNKNLFISIQTFKESEKSSKDKKNTKTDSESNGKSDTVVPKKSSTTNENDS